MVLIEQDQPRPLPGVEDIVGGKERVGEPAAVTVNQPAAVADAAVNEQGQYPWA